MRLALLAALLLVALIVLPSRASAATCSDYETQADAQRAGDTRDADGDGILCESLPCPCAGPGSGGNEAPASRPKVSCRRPASVQRITFSRRRYARIYRHYQQAVRLGWPKTLMVNRRGADERRDKLLDRTRVRRQKGHDLDEFPPAVGRGRGSRALRRGSDPTGWSAHVRSVPSSENRAHGASLGGQLRRFCDGTRFRYSWRR